MARLIHFSTLMWITLLLSTANGQPPSAAPPPPAPGISAEQWRQMQAQQKKLEEARKEEKARSTPGFTVMRTAGQPEVAAPVPAPPPPVVAPTAPAHAENGMADDPAAEAMKANQKLQEAYGKLNSANPASADFDALGAVTGPAAQMQKFLANPWIKSYLSVLQNPAIQKSLLEIVNHPNRNILIYAQFGWMILIALIRVWRGALAKGMGAKMWISVWTFGLYVFGSALVVPYLVLGGIYFRVIGQIGTAMGILGQ